MREEIKNTIQFINTKNLDSLKENFENNNKVLVVELNGANINSWRDYIAEIQSKFKFSIPCYDSIDGYLDFMRDLQWLDNEEFIIIINNFGDFCKENPKIKKEIILDFEEIILPFWQDEIKDTVVDGEPKIFKIYLVE